MRNRVTWVARRLGRTLVRDLNRLSIRGLCRRWGLSWHFIMALVASWSEQVVAERRRHRYVTVLINSETGEGLGVVRHRDAKALRTFLAAQGRRWCRGVKVVITDGSESHRAATRTHLGSASHAVERFHVARWFAASLIEVRCRIQGRGGPPDTKPVGMPA